MNNLEAGSQINYIFRACKYSVEKNPAVNRKNAQNAATDIKYAFENSGAQLPGNVLRSIFSANSPNKVSLNLRRQIPDTLVSNAIKSGRIK